MRAKTALSTSTIVTIQDSLRRALPLVHGCKEYREQLALLEKIDLLLKMTGIEKLFVRLSLEQYDENSLETSKEIKTQKDLWKEELARSQYAKRSEQVLRCCVLRNLLGESYRGMSNRLAEAALFRWFCKLDELEIIRVPSKSTLQAYDYWLPEEKMKQVLDTLTLALQDEKKAQELGLERALSMEIAYVDTTCLEANIHFPADWVLMRDAIRTLIKAIIVIRRHGLKKRIPEPSFFISRINGLCIAMTASYRKTDSKGRRKKVLYSMKKLTKVVKEHGERYRNALDKEWNTTDLSRKEAEVILRRIDSILKQLPEAMRQAHERIIGERQVPSEEKILSLYEKDIHVINRGKQGARVEFGNTLLIAEEASGYILSHELLKETSPGDAKLLLNHCNDLQRLTSNRLTAIGADRKFQSVATKNLLAGKNIYNGICPRDPQELSRRLNKEEKLKPMLTRRAQSEARIGILKNVFLQEIPRAKGYEHRKIQVALAVLAHNLWIVARKAPWKEETEPAPLAA